MPDLFGHTRAHLGARHALITPENHVASQLPGVQGATAVVLINEAMGARFAQTLLTFTASGSARVPASGIETCGYLQNGGALITAGEEERRCGSGGYFFVPAGEAWSLADPDEGTRLTLFQKRYVPLAGTPPPPVLFGDADEVQGTAFLGDPAANLQVLLPDSPAWDLAVNVFTYQPGGHLPFVEVHVMEHGLLMLGGAGVYRLEDRWYPVQEGDVLWMGPYCAQWFVAMGKTPASYLYYKDVNRPAL
jgi:(S)-ureidoglycine aminohydrolase